MRGKKIIALIIALLMISTLIASCSGGINKETVMSYNGKEIKGYMYSYWLSTYKTFYVSLEDDTPEYWSQTLNDEYTYEKFVKERIDDQIKHNIVYLSLFDEYGLTLSDEEIYEAEKSAENFLAALGNDEKKLNENLKAFGVDYELFKEMRVIEAKIDAVDKYLFGENGTNSATEADVEEYYKNNYSRVKILTINNAFEYEYDSDGNIVYDQSTGERKTTALSDAKKAEKNALADEVEKKITAGEDFEKLIGEYDDNADAIYYPNGYYVCPNYFEIYGVDIVNASESMAVGETKRVSDDYGIYFLKKYDLLEKAYNDPTDAKQFANIWSYCKSGAINKFMEPFIAEITVNDKELSKYTVAKAALKGIS